MSKPFLRSRLGFGTIAPLNADELRRSPRRAPGRAWPSPSAFNVRPHPRSSVLLRIVRLSATTSCRRSAASSLWPRSRSGRSTSSSRRRLGGAPVTGASATSRLAAAAHAEFGCKARKRAQLERPLLGPDLVKARGASCFGCPFQGIPRRPARPPPPSARPRQDGSRSFGDRSKTTRGRARERGGGRGQERGRGIEMRIFMCGLKGGKTREPKKWVPTSASEKATFQLHVINYAARNECGKQVCRKPCRIMFQTSPKQL